MGIYQRKLTLFSTHDKDPVPFLGWWRGLVGAGPLRHDPLRAVIGAQGKPDIRRLFEPQGTIVAHSLGIARQNQLQVCGSDVLNFM